MYYNIMIPYIEIPRLIIWGSIAIQPFGLLVLTGCIAGFFVTRYYTGSQGLAQGRFFELASWVLVLGCTIDHDHPGIHSHFILAVKYPDGARHDLGFYEWLFTIGLIVVLLFIRRADFPSGAIIGRRLSRSWNDFALLNRALFIEI
jgi:hypothetical protein